MYVLFQQVVVGVVEHKGEEGAGNHVQGSGGSAEEEEEMEEEREVEEGGDHADTVMEVDTGGGEDEGSGGESDSESDSDDDDFLNDLESGIQSND
jgi:hypothetical protein